MKKAKMFLLATMLVSVLVLGAIFFIKRPPVSAGIPAENLSSQRLIEVPCICQYPNLPTGCEAVAATMVLNYYGENITAEKFAGEWLRADSNFYRKNGKLYGPDPNEVFAGNPFSKNSYGCFAGPIVTAVNENSTDFSAHIIKGKTLQQLCEEYIENNKPILIWATMGMRGATYGNSWYLCDGTLFTWTAGEHCLVLVGYNEEFYFFNDPMSGSTVAFKKNVAEKRFSELKMQAVVIDRK